MNWNQIEGQWLQMVGNVKTQWGKLTDDDIKIVAGKRDQLIGKVQERYGILRAEAEEQVSEWSSKVAATTARSAEKSHDAKPAKPAKPAAKPDFAHDGKPAAR